MTFISGNKDFMMEVPKGTIPNTFGVNKFGSNLNSPANTTTDVWDIGGTYIYPSTTDITHVHQVANSNPNMQIEVEGLDSNWDLVIQTVTLDGVGATFLIALSTPLIRIFRMKVISPPSGSISDVTAVNAGDTIIYAQITNGNNQTLMALYTVPSGHTAYMVSIYGDVVESTGKEPKSTEFNLWVRDNESLFPFQLKNARAIPKAGASITKEFAPYLKITEKSDIRTSTFCTDEPGHVHAGFDLIVEKN